jgi:hypothetical protein
MNRDDALAELRRLCPPGTTVYTILRHVSRSGMSRRISAIVRSAEGPLLNLDWFIERTGLYKSSSYGDGLVIGGCGMDMGFAMVYGLSRSLYPHGFECVGERRAGFYCPANDHTNGDRNYSPHTHKDGGYALIHQWL